MAKASKRIFFNEMSESIEIRFGTKTRSCYVEIVHNSLYVEFTCRVYTKNSADVLDVQNSNGFIPQFFLCTILPLCCIYFGS